MEGWEDGLLQYPENLYNQVSMLVKSLELLPETAQCWFETSSDGTIYYADGVKIGIISEPK